MSVSKVHPIDVDSEAAGITDVKPSRHPVSRHTPTYRKERLFHLAITIVCLSLSITSLVIAHKAYDRRTNNSTAWPAVNTASSAADVIAPEQEGLLANLAERVELLANLEQRVQAIERSVHRPLFAPPEQIMTKLHPGRSPRPTGKAMAMSATVLVTGSSGVNDLRFAEGAVWAYERVDTGQFVFSAQLDPTDGGAGDGFGSAVAISSDSRTIVVGASGRRAAYIFDRQSTGQYTLTAKLTVTGPHVLGESVAIVGNTIVIGANGVSRADPDSVFVFEMDPQGGYHQVAQLPAYDEISQDSIAFDGAIIAVGAPRDNDKGSMAGAVYVFEKNATQWLQTAKLVAPDGHSFSMLGGSVAVSNGRIVAGASNAFTERGFSGAAYVFEKDAAIDQHKAVAKLVPTDGADRDSAGLVVAIAGDTVVVTSMLDDDHHDSSGSAAVFKRDSTGAYVQTRKLRAPNPSSRALFGREVALWDTILAVSSGDGIYMANLTRP
eukprot:TRINITY_DN7472_c0_g1_i1.p1 TRINITY_DN7472_c0_g1~~TRINITY_DN7472_c0_g1_i1.p1  ORF type:complete len:493 (+),score=56.09 TRINITY_DN7472_c0_g1_i1:496-1974(+)